MMPGEEWPFDPPEGYRSLGQGDPLAPMPPPVDASGWLRGIQHLFPVSTTNLAIAAQFWPLCWRCRVLVFLHLWRFRDRHIRRRHPGHPDAPFRIIVPRLGTFIRPEPPSRSYGGRVHDVHGEPGQGWPPCWCGHGES